MDIYVGNLPWSIDDTALGALFSPYGKVARAKVMMDRDTGRSRGFGFVTMSDANEANAAIKALNGSQMQGRPLRVNEAQPRQGGPGGPGGGGGGGGMRSRGPREGGYGQG